MYRSIFHWRPLLNGYSSYWPIGFPERMALAQKLPDPEALEALTRETGLAMILVHLRGIGPAKRRAWLSAANRGGPGGLRLVARHKDDLLLAVDGE
jgi:hypothetical protein